MKIKDCIDKINDYIEKERPIQEYWDEEFFYQFKDICPLLVEATITPVHYSHVNEHRWYGLQDIVYKIEYNGDMEYVKVEAVTQSYSELQDLTDIYHVHSIFQIVHPKEVKTIIYE